MSTFTNRHGQTINPGDQVVVIAKGYSNRINEYIGTFVGTSAGGSPQVRVKFDTRVWVDAAGNPTKWYYGCKKDGVHTEVRQVLRTRTYPRGRVYRIA